jgi:hypothetical protein
MRVTRRWVLGRSEVELLRILADCEQRLLAIEKETEELGLSLAPTIKHNIECSRQTLEHCLEKMAVKDTRQSEIFADLTLLRSNFAVGAFEAERTEALVGEADFLSLSADWKDAASDALHGIIEAIDQLARSAKRTKD